MGREINKIQDVDALEIGSVVHFKGKPRHTLVVASVMHSAKPTHEGMHFPISLVTVDDAGRPHSITVSAFTLVLVA